MSYILGPEPELSSSGLDALLRHWHGVIHRLRSLRPGPHGSISGRSRSPVHPGRRTHDSADSDSRDSSGCLARALVSRTRAVRTSTYWAEMRAGILVTGAARRPAGRDGALLTVCGQSVPG